jgi:hypothetical protein
MAKESKQENKSEMELARIKLEIHKLLLAKYTTVPEMIYILSDLTAEISGRALKH